MSDSITLSEWQPDRNLGLELVRATEAAAIRATPFVGRGDKNAADGAAVDAMRRFLASVSMNGFVVIGEGEKDEAPWLYNGEKVGNGTGAECDVAVDPIDGTRLSAEGRPGALSVIAVADRGSMYDPSAVFYMDKIVCGPEGVDVVDIRKPIGENIRALARAKGVDVSDIRVAVLDRPRHAQLIQDIREAGAGTQLIMDGDVAGGVNAARFDSRIDMCVGIGGTPEGIITACAVKTLGGLIQGRLMPRDDEEKQRAIDAGHDLDAVLDQNTLVKSDNTYFVATGITDADFLAGVKRHGEFVRAESIVLRSYSGTVRHIVSDMREDRWGV
ncbi:class II fructose-bisphosphatase [Canibacter sp. lx-45]|uniref:class II fructose-bisphosphatase n=2 Tax=Canibacter zhuwentaonis TaxID=2837491 RepID=UPI001BDCB604|nr:class II fructose-bisphosphatase [Canibacter zhuwentaonis]MBT1035919.1 class II fructose-bisphosphatase [Canibacter zhuwentaonis]